jgi:hypothetical protein
MNDYNGFNSLLEGGICIFKIDSENLEQKFDESLRQQTEINFEPPYVGGGFAALGNASSFHTPFVRSLRIEALDKLKEAIRNNEIVIDPNSKVEIVPDRQTMRPTGMVPTAETWHRDMSPIKLSKSNPYVVSNNEDIIFGGWVNCNSNKSQYFVCVPGTHIAVNSGNKTGFQKVDKQTCKENKITVEIPPGYGMFFIQSLVHCVNAKKLPFDMKRVYISVRISSSDTQHPMILDIVDRLRDGAIVPMKSGQLPPMYPKLWQVNWQDKLIAFSEKFGEEMKTKKNMIGKRLRNRDDTPDEGEYFILNRFAPSVKPSVPYSDAEIALYLPHHL